MAKMMNIKVLGIVENMSYFVCPDCGKKHRLFGSGSESVAEETGTKILAKIPVDPDLSTKIDSGLAERCNVEEFAAAVKAIEAL